MYVSKRYVFRHPTLVATRETNQFTRRCHPYARKSASQAVLSRMQLTLHATRRTPHGASCLVLAMSARSVKTRRAPSRHCRDARVYGHTTTAMHDNDYTPPPHAHRSQEARRGISHFHTFQTCFTFRPWSSREQAEHSRNLATEPSSCSPTQTRPKLLWTKTLTTSLGSSPATRCSLFGCLVALRAITCRRGLNIHFIIRVTAVDSRSAYRRIYTSIPLVARKKNTIK